jgi:outer membrane receptor protein involved in Fe transport
MGFKGNLGLKDWTWEVYGSIGSTDSVADYFGFLDRARYQELIKQPNYGAGYSASFGLIGRLATCTSGINPFVNTPVSKDCIDIVDGKLKTTTTLGQRSIEANFQGAGFSLPAGESRFAFGADYRSNTIAYRPDPGMSKDNILSNAIGIFGAADVTGSASVKEVYGEADFPILANMTAVKKLELNVGYRYSDYDTKAGAVDTWKALLSWQVNDYVTFRGGPQRATRAPNIAEMFTPSTVLVTLWPTGDPCSTNTTPPGVPWANTAGNPNRQKVIDLCNQLAVGSTTGPISTSYGGLGFYFPLALDQQVGNPDVKSEKGTTYTFGTVLRSPFESAALSNLTATIDYYHIKIDGAITPLTSEIAYRQCFNANGVSNPAYSLSNPYCQLIHRSPTGATDTVIGKFTNIGMLQTSGVDLNLDWRAMLNDIGIGLPGALTANLAYTKLLEYKVQVATGEKVTDYKGSSGFDTNTGAQFSWKSLLSVGYAVGPANVSLRWRHLPSVMNAGKVLNPTSTVRDTDSNDQFDLFGGWKVTDHVTVRAGIENVFDKDPPIVGASPASTAAGNTDASVYDILGRRYFVGVKAKF